MRKVLLVCVGAVAAALGVGLAVRVALHSKSRHGKKPFRIFGVAGLDTGKGTRDAGLPFFNSTVESVPRATTPGGAELTLAMVVGRYDWGFSYGGHTLEIGADGTWQFGAGGCTWSGESSGTARVSEGRLIFEMTDGDTKNGRVCACVPVFWGKRVYLLGAGDLNEFANAVNWGTEPRATAAAFDLGYLPLVRHEGDAWNQGLPEAPGLPDLPSDLASRILKTPLEGKITSVAGSQATINLGAEDGVFVGLRLSELRKDGYCSDLEVLSVGSHSCVAKRTLSDDTPPDDRVGQRVSCPGPGAARLKK